MEKSHMNIFIPQWQGGGQDLSTYDGGQEIKIHYFYEPEPVEVTVSTENVSNAKNGIIGYDEIFEQLSQAKSLIARGNPRTIFTVGGGCDAGIMPISYLNKILDENMTLLYFDAHGDLNTPESSESKCFYGMSLRTLLGEGDKKILDLLFSKLSPDQVVLLGTRDLDKPEIDYIRNRNISVLMANHIDLDVEHVIRAVKAKGHKNIYVHIDLDVLDPDEFMHVPVPVSGGLKNNTLLSVLYRLNEAFDIAGLGLFEFSPRTGREINLVQEIVQIGSNLTWSKPVLKFREK